MIGELAYGVLAVYSVQNSVLMIVFWHMQQVFPPLSTVQYSSVQCSKGQYNTVQYSRAESTGVIRVG